MSALNTGEFNCIRQMLDLKGDIGTDTIGRDYNTQQMINLNCFGFFYWFRMMFCFHF